MPPLPFSLWSKHSPLYSSLWSWDDNIPRVFTFPVRTPTRLHWLLVTASSSVLIWHHTIMKLNLILITFLSLLCHRPFATSEVTTIFSNIFSPIFRCCSPSHSPLFFRSSTDTNIFSLYLVYIWHNYSDYHFWYINILFPNFSNTFYNPLD
jgi:hypothetical protein